MRGKVVASVVLVAVSGITPAYAGKSPTPAPWRFYAQDHPRLCGEKSSLSPYRCRQSGSPPPMRGKEASNGFPKTWTRITPAYAGKSRLATCLHQFVWDHPRLCGEKEDTRRRKWRQSGSPPPMRGKGPAPPAAMHSSRITPAYAGKSVQSSQQAVERWDHPRLCGEKYKTDGKAAQHTGSPPPMRGKESDGFTALIGAGITPAYAGKRKQMCNFFRIP